jgi:hypothetical protein
MRERKPIRLLGPGWLTNRIYVVAAYKVHDNGMIEATGIKHDVTEDFDRLLCRLSLAEIKRRRARLLHPPAWLCDVHDRQDCAECAAVDGSLHGGAASVGPVGEGL